MLTPSTPEREKVESDETDAVNILINTLKREGGRDEAATTDIVSKLKTGKGRVSFEARKTYPSTTQMQNKSVRTSLVIPNAPINKDHQTLLGESSPGVGKTQ